MILWNSTSVTVFFISFFVTLIVLPRTIAVLRSLKAGQVIQKEGPETHAAKAGTPAMGGLVILFGFLVGSAWIIYKQMTIATAGLIPDRHLGAMAAVLLLVLVYALIGVVDDWMTIKPKNGRRGIGSKPKFLLQFLASTLFVVWLVKSGQMNTTVNLGTWFVVDLGWAYAPLAVLFITGMANFVNITDGLDGLAAGLTVILALALSLIPGAFSLENMSFSLMFIALAGACAAFLWFNFNPAKVFMGDTGSLAIGAAIPALAIIAKLEIPMIIAGMVFILDGLSSAVQWAVFKYTRITTGTGVRVFKMSPIHHHFELAGWPEQLVVIRFWILGGLFAALAVLFTTLRTF